MSTFGNFISSDVVLALAFASFALAAILGCLVAAILEVMRGLRR